MTARWVVDEVRPHRDLNITWQPISLMFKNEVAEDADGYPRVSFTHNLLRVLESVRRTDGNAGVEAAYWEMGRRIHHDRTLLEFSADDVLASVGLDASHADAFEDASFDAEIRSRMDVGLELAGNDIGTPIIGFTDAGGDKVGLFGPVITRVPDTDLSLQLWDGMIAVATVPGFWELKRTRTERPEFGQRP